MAIPSGENNQCQKETEGRKNMKYSENWKKKNTEWPERQEKGKEGKRREGNESSR